MTSSKETSHAFIVRLWIEPRVLSTAKPIWRGVIENVEDGERTYFDKLDLLMEHAMACLKALEVTVNLHSPETGVASDDNPEPLVRE